ncbi:hypothetical protein BDZ89DRAFT_1152711 [Hymenopellis radicata]|nr:hypothetical protein BDZ89DRAFT_1152711 [Hymenopellis radicata]
MPCFPASPALASSVAHKPAVTAPLRRRSYGALVLTIITRSTSRFIPRTRTAIQIAGTIWLRPRDSGRRQQLARMSRASIYNENLRLKTSQIALSTELKCKREQTRNTECPAWFTGYFAPYS